MNKSIGLTPTLLIRVPEGYEVDFIIQNLSANNLYLNQSKSEGTAHGIEIATSTSLAKDHYPKDVWVVADGASSDVRYLFTYRKLK